MLSQKDAFDLKDDRKPLTCVLGCTTDWQGTLLSSQDKNYIKVSVAWG